MEDRLLPATSVQRGMAIPRARSTQVERALRARSFPDLQVWRNSRCPTDPGRHIVGRRGEEPNVLLRVLFALTAVVVGLILAKCFAYH